MKLSPNFERVEFERDNSIMPDESIVDAYVQLCVMILEPLRAWAGEAFFVTSGYRSIEANARIGGVKDSQHVATAKFCACDGFFESHRASMQGPFDWLRLDSGLPFDQLILEHGKLGDVIHVSWSIEPRRQALEGATFNQSAYETRYVSHGDSQAT
jgi:hypothetical protein